MESTLNQPAPPATARRVIKQGTLVSDNAVTSWKTTLGNVLATLSPWVVIAGLIYMALFTHPGMLGDTVTAPPLSTIDSFYGAASLGAKDVWIVGNIGKIIHTHDGGQTWATQESGTQADLQAVAAWDDDHLVAVGDQGTVLVTADGGAEWASVHVPLESRSFNKLLGVRISGQGAAWAVGENGAILQSIDRGQTWVLKHEAQAVTFHDVATANGRVWVVGELGTILTSGDDGATWSKQATGVESTLNGVYFRDASNGVAVGLEGTLLVTSDGGQSWHNADVSRERHFFSVSWNPATEEWLVAGDKGVVAVADAGADHWDVRQLDESSFAWHSFAVPDGPRWLLVGATVGFYSGTGGWHRLLSPAAGDRHG